MIVIKDDIHIVQENMPEVQSTYTSKKEKKARKEKRGRRRTSTMWGSTQDVCMDAWDLS